MVQWDNYSIWINPNSLRETQKVKLTDISGSITRIIKMISNRGNFGTYYQTTKNEIPMREDFRNVITELQIFDFMGDGKSVNGYMIPNIPKIKAFYWGIYDDRKLILSETGNLEKAINSFLNTVNSVNEKGKSYDVSYPFSTYSTKTMVNFFNGGEHNVPHLDPKNPIARGMFIKTLNDEIKAYGVEKESYDYLKDRSATNSKENLINWLHTGVAKDKTRNSEADPYLQYIEDVWSGIRSAKKHFYSEAYEMEESGTSSSSSSSSSGGRKESEDDVDVIPSQPTPTWIPRPSMRSGGSDGDDPDSSDDDSDDDNPDLLRERKKNKKSGSSKKMADRPKNFTFEKTDEIRKKVAAATQANENKVGEVNKGTDFLIDLSDLVLIKAGTLNPIRLYIDYERVKKDEFADVFAHLLRVTKGQYKIISFEDGHPSYNVAATTGIGISIDQSLRRMLNIEEPKIDSVKKMISKLEDELTIAINSGNASLVAVKTKELQKIKKNQTQLDLIIKKTSKVADSPFKDISTEEGCYSMPLGVGDIRSLLEKNSLNTIAMLDLITTSMNETFSEIVNMAIGFGNLSLTPSPADPKQLAVYNCVIGRTRPRKALKEREVIPEGLIKTRLAYSPENSAETLGKFGEDNALRLREAKKFVLSGEKDLIKEATVADKGDVKMESNIPRRYPGDQMESNDFVRSIVESTIKGMKALQEKAIIEA